MWFLPFFPYQELKTSLRRFKISYNFSDDECKQDPIVEIVKQEFGFTFGAFLVEKPIMADANFTAYYQIEEEGCGTECYTFNMKDLRTGEMIDSPNNCPGGFAYFPCSSLLICNSDTIEEESYRQYSGYTPTAYFWNEEKRAFFQIEHMRKMINYQWSITDSQLGVLENWMLSLNIAH